MSEANKDSELTAEKDRANKLAREKSYLQLIIDMMQKLGMVSGLDNTIQSLLGIIIENIGGINATLYYRMNDDVYVGDITHAKNKIEDISDENVKKVFNTHEFLEIEHEFKDTMLMLTPEFTKAFTWVFPLMAGKNIIGVIKIEDLHIASQDFKNELPTFFNYAATILKNDILRYVNLKNINDSLSKEQTLNEELAEKNNEYQALNEEYTATIEELNQSNKELAEKNIEYQALNEEYTAIIEELNQTNKDLIQANETIQFSEQKTKALIENVNIGIFQSSLEGKLFLANSSIIEMSGYDNVDDFCNISAQNLYFDSNDRIYVINELKNKGFVKNKEMRSKKKNGDTYWISMNAIFLKDIDGNPISILGSIEDITERKLSAEVLRKSEEKYRLIFEYSPLGLLSFNDIGVISACNENFAHIIGTTQERLIGLKMLNLPDKNIVSAVQKALNGNLGLYEGDYSSVSAKKITPVRCLFTPMKLGDEGIIGGMGIIEDISERKKSEAQILNLVNTQSAILNNAAYMVISTDCNGIITTFNPAAERALGYTLEECVGKLTPINFHDFAEIEERARLFSEELGVNVEPNFDVFTSKALLGQPNEFEWTYIRKDGIRFPVLLSITALFDSQKNIMGFLGMANDISSERKLNNELKELNMLKSHFITMISHEFRTPLTSILSSVELLERYSDKWDNEKKEEIYKRIYNTVKYTNLLLKDVEIIEKVNNSAMTCSYSIVNVPDLCNKIVDEIRNVFNFDLKINVIIDNQISDIKTDENLIKHALKNILSNGIKYSEMKPVYFLVNLTHDNKICFLIKDNGVGIPEKDLKHIFLPFHRSSNVETIKGVGLGLTMAKRCIDSLNGYIVVESIEGQGTVVSVILSL